MPPNRQLATARQNCVAYHFPQGFGHRRTIVRKKKKAAKTAALSLAGLKPLVGLCVVLVFVDALAHVVGFVIELALILRSEVTIVLRHIFLFVILQPLFAAFQTPRFARRELAALYAVRDPVLLVLFALVDLIHARMTRVDIAGSGTSGVVLLCSSGSDIHQATRRKD